MGQGYDALTRGLNLNQPGAAESQIAELLEESGVKFPSAYLDLLRFTNGAEGFIDSENYIIIFRIEDLIEYNEGYGIPEFAPGCFLFASDGGGSAYLFDTGAAGMPIVGIPFDSLMERPVRLAGSLPEFLYDLVRIREIW
ncbi:MAG: Cell wall assembly/cell proliferation coordinating protein KNR4-like protein [Chlorobi bacterium]|nr:Cell wall assembly/cell proliferation coordinating protein KNR4-like protein [Chlorobiota bacterium]